MIRNKFLAFKTALILLAFLLPSCEEKQEQECDAVCEAKKTDFEHLTTRVKLYQYERLSNFDARKTATGAIASYKPAEEWLKAELSPEEWQNFIKALYKNLNKYLDKNVGENYCHDGSSFNCTGSLVIREYEENYCYDGCEFGECYNCNRRLFISYPDSIKYKKGHMKPSDLDNVEKTIDDVLSIIRKRTEFPLEANLKVEYQKRFGESIADAELSMNEIDFSFIPNEIEEYRKNYFHISVTRTETGALLEYLGDMREKYGEPVTVHKAELDIGEWLDFVRTIYKSGINKWENKYGGDSASLFYSKSALELFYEKWRLKIYHSDKVGVRKIEGYDAYPPNWDEFMKVMDGMKAKAREKHP
ncbi:MAG: hypothetical protein LBQ87_08370 [Candidatus Fibromonas sp.]|jgi:hypothetical protein|nr:hypothetical protein [Candidatus Fibromonas sp.]